MHKYVLKQTREDFLKDEDNRLLQDFDEEEKQESGEEDEADNLMRERSVKVSYLAGVINKFDQERFKRLVFRVTKGTTWS